MDTASIIAIFSLALGIVWGTLSQIYKQLHRIDTAYLGVLALQGSMERRRQQIAELQRRVGALEGQLGEEDTFIRD